MEDSIQVMFVALCAVCIGIIFDLMGSESIFLSIVGRMFIMGAFVIGITAFLLFLREWILVQGE